MAGQYHFPLCGKVMVAAKLVRAGEEVVEFHPGQLGGHTELWAVRMMAFVTIRPFHHVVAVGGRGAASGCK